ncbi:MAG: glycoside hydrolase family 5 protein [Pseudobutyrivibrio sp.]|uniref:glycoside hydrolase family 5 protein n=1 Tax=Pseudobutyrivibrio sp. TaxID=2014367 RepID=UPI0025D53F6A|nr:glycoside hydrolase family 5 protein [Pseudobutyrivibrio sp.]MBQ8488659.1 glycoside hydrolase family 5 protein [Pseudobutyrivibrio sp.]
MKMVSKRQKFLTVILVIVLAIVIVGGVFGISYMKGDVTFPWQLVETEAKKEEVKEPAKEQKELKVTVKEPKSTEQDKEVAKEEPKEEKEQEPVKEPAALADGDSTGVTLDYYGALHVEDGALVDNTGKAVQLTGVSSHGLSWFPEYVTADSIKSLRDNWGINVIRLAMYTSDYNGYCVGGQDIKDTLKENIDEAVKAATDNDMYVIIDWHILNDSNPNEYKADAIQFFGEMVRKYEDNENVIYEICNEPNGDTTWEDIKAYANEVIPVIRNVNKDALILVGTPKWSSDLDSVMGDPLDFDNIMYTYHFYAGSHKSSARNALTNALEEGLPVFISEYGFVSADGDGAVDSKEAAKWQEVIDEYQLSSCIWNLSNKAEGSALIASDCDKTADLQYDDLSEQGQYFFDMLKDNTKQTKSNTEKRR